MNRPVEQHAFDTALAKLRSPQWSDPTILLVMRFICIGGLVLANYYAFTMTATGFVTTEFLPNNSVLPNSFIPIVVAGFMQLGILGFYLAVPYFQRRYLVLNLLASGLAVVLILLSALFALFSITHNAQSATIVGQYTGSLSGMNKTVGELDGVIVTTFAGHLQELDLLAQRACRGQDKTGIPVCGPISAGYANQVNVLREKYSAQLGQPAPYAELADPQNILGSLSTVQANYLRLSQKVEAFTAFAAEQGLSINAITSNFDALGQQITGFANGLGQRDPDEKLLVLTRVFDELGRAVALNAEPLTYFAISIAFLPDALAVMFTLLLVIIAGVNQQSVRMRRQAGKVVEEAMAYDVLASAIDRWKLSRAQLQDRRRLANNTAANTGWQA
jgi:hypothetical protein